MNPIALNKDVIQWNLNTLIKSSILWFPNELQNISISSAHDVR